MSGIEKLQFDHEQILYVLDLKNVLYQNFINILLIINNFIKFLLQGGGCTCTLSPHLWVKCQVKKNI